ncbi:MAG TPA: branched-chain amino acid ABC transporter permease [Xanthobacteraceae bacterium]|jgi:branched-chain amino acid transport system permease protein|nr:branched-chain amino acid ABC transporter permease [Xanthobacteraceae bacterium]
MKASSTPRAAVVAALLALMTVPLWVGNSYYVDVASQILLFAVFALALNVLAGYAGLVSLGHAGLFAISGYTAALMLQAGFPHATAAAGAVLATLVTSAVFAVLALRATGIGFLMITLALGQTLWGIAYRWVNLTNGDNGVNIAARPAPFGISLAGAPSFYYATLVVFLLALAAMAAFDRSPFGASLRGTRDQARRMTALGYNVWLIRFLAFLFSGFWCSVAGLLYLYNKQFISPQVSALQASAEVLLMVISGGTATLLGPVAGAAIVVIMKYVVSAYVVRWNLVLGVIFVAIISFMPEGLVPGSVRIWGFARRRFFALPRRRGTVREGAQPQARCGPTGPLAGSAPQPPDQVWGGEGKDSRKPSPGAPP